MMSKNLTICCLLALILRSWHLATYNCIRVVLLKPLISGTRSRWFVKEEMSIFAILSDYFGLPPVLDIK